MNVFDLVASIKLDDTDYENGLNKAKSAASSFGGAMAGAFSTAAKVTVGATTALTGAMIAGASSTASYGDNIDKASQKLGISSDAYQEWDFILQHSGASIDGLKAGIRTMTKELTSSMDVINKTAEADAALEEKLEKGEITFEEYNKQYDELYAGAYENLGALGKLGFSMQEIEDMSGSSEEAFAKIIAKLQEMPEGTERAALAQELLGRSSMELGALLNTSAEETEAMKQQVHELGGVIESDGVKAAAAYQDSLQNMTTVFGGLKNNLMGKFLPSMTKVMDGITAVFSGDKSGTAQIVQGIKDVITNIKEAVPEFLEAGGDIMSALLEAIIESLPELAESALEIVTTLVEGIVNQLPQISSTAVELIVLIVNTLAQNLPMIIQAGIQLIATLCESLAQQAPTLVPVVLDALKTIVMTLINNAPQLLQAALTLILALAQGLIDYLPQLIDDLPTIISTIVETLVGMSGQILEAGIELLVALAGGLIKGIPQLVMKLPEIIASMVDGLLEGLADMASVGYQLVQGLWEGISDAEEWVVEKIKGFGGKIVKGIKGFFGIHSPSTVFAEIGEYMAEGLGQGWDDTVDDVIKGMNDDMDLEGNVSVMPNTDGFDEATSAYGSAQLAGIGDIVIPVYIGQDRIDELLVRAEQLRNYRSGGR